MSIFLRTEPIISEWTDYNGHMNLAFYIHLFDAGWEVLLQKFNMGETSLFTLGTVTHFLKPVDSSPVWYYDL